MLRLEVSHAIGRSPQAKGSHQHIKEIHKAHKFRPVATSDL